MGSDLEQPKCSGCGKPVDQRWKVCPSCGAQVRKPRLCPACKNELEEGWRSCPYCGMAIIETFGPSVSIKDSVVKEIHQNQQTDIQEAKGAIVGGSIHINVGRDGSDSRTSGTPEYQYEKYVMAVLHSGGNLERARTQLEQRRDQLGLSLKQSKEIESHCLAEVNKSDVFPADSREAQKQKIESNHIAANSVVTKLKKRKHFPWWAIAVICIAVIGLAVAIFVLTTQRSSPSPVPAQTYAPNQYVAPISAFAANPISQKPVTQYNLNITVNPFGSGSVIPGGGRYNDGDKVTLVATPSPGYQFISWSGSVSGSNSAINITLDGDKNIVANFSVVRYTLTASVNPPNGGTVQPASTTVDSGKTFNLTATPASGYRFVSWSGGASGTAPTIAIEMTSDKSIIASFEPIDYIQRQFTAGTNSPVTITVAMKNGSILEGTMSISGGGNDIRFLIKDPYGNTIVDKNRAVSTFSFNVKAQNDGSYIMYFDNSFSFITSKQVSISYRVLP